MKFKSGQVKIQQMAFLIIGLTIFFVFVGLFVLMFTLSGLSQTRSELERERAILLVSQLADFPEFACGSAFGTEKINCVDFDKAFVLKSNINDFKEIFGVDGIQIVKVYPESSVVCTSGSYPDCGSLTIFDDGGPGVYTSTFVSLCRKERAGGSFYNKCEIARLMVKFK
ncbi:MAG: hypothetical protein KKB62_03630 [Nanoarchaeota archaeon]|nr:hypothetical protein [Nanoarchaeota archaeon]